MKRIVLVLSMILAMVLSGCSHKSEQVRLMDAADQIQGMEDHAPTGALSEAFRETIVYEVSDISWDGDSGTAEVKVTTPDLGAIISNAIQAAIDTCGTEDYDVLLDNVKENVQAALNSGEHPTLESTVEMDAEKTEDGYTLIGNEDFEKIISGNLEEIFAQALVEEFANENAKEG